MKCMKKLAAVAVVLVVTASSSFAEWDKFSVIEDGSGEAKLGFEDGTSSLNIRYGLMENLELFGTVGTGLTDGNYAIGARYQIMDMLSGFLDVDVSTARGINGYYDLGLTPGINFTMPFTETISFGSGLKLGVALADPDAKMNLGVGVEVDIMLGEKVGMWVGVDLTMEDFTNDNYEFEAKDAIDPGLGFFFSAENLTVGTYVKLKLNHMDGTDEAMGLVGGVEFALKF
jgi:hypothetical protein